MKCEEISNKDSGLKPEVKSILYAGTGPFTRAVAKTFVDVLRSKPTEVVAAYGRRVRLVMFDSNNINYLTLGRHLAAEQVLLERIQPTYFSLKK